MGVVGIVAGLTGKADDVTPFIDRHRRVPRRTSQIADVRHRVAFPEHGMRGGEASDRLVASARDANDLAPVVDRGGGAGGVTGEGRELPDRVASRPPEDGPKLQDLGRDAGRVMHRVFRPPDHLTPVVGAGGEAVVASQRGERPHRAPFPHESATDPAGCRRRRKKGGAAPALSQRIRGGRLSDAHDHAPVVLHRPGHAAVGAAERAEVEDRTGEPQRRVPVLVPRQVGITRHPAAIVEAVAPADRSAERGEIRDAIFTGIGPAMGGAGQQS